MVLLSVFHVVVLVVLHTSVCSGDDEGFCVSGGAADGCLSAYPLSVYRLDGEMGRWMDGWVVGGRTDGWMGVWLVGWLVD